MKLLPLFLAGFAAGLSACWPYIGSLKATIKLYEAYIERIDAPSKGGAGDEKPVPSFFRPFKTPSASIGQTTSRTRIGPEVGFHQPSELGRRMRSLDVV